MVLKKANRLAISIATFAAMSAINYSIIHNPIVLLLSFVLLLHELGHYFMGKYYGADAKFPIFIPLIFFSIGITPIYNLKDQYKSRVALAGPLLAVCFILLTILTNLTTKLFSTKLLFLVLAGEIVLNYFGSDGKRYRKHRALDLNISFS
jgi:hypothetical protein